MGLIENLIDFDTSKPLEAFSESNPACHAKKKDATPVPFPSNVQQVLSTLHTGDSFGELSLLYNIRREVRSRKKIRTAEMVAWSILKDLDVRIFQPLLVY